MKNRLWYFPLEPIKSRYTEQLCNEWMPDAFESANNGEFKVYKIDANTQDLGEEIKVGQVLDATGRGIYSMRQIEFFLGALRKGSVKPGDVIFLQDYWTPGFMAVPYALHQMGMLNQICIYSMLHAQSVDPYDFTHPMEYWMRGWELSLDRVSTGIFVASTIHYEELRNAGFKAPIHVVSLPISVERVKQKMPKHVKKRKQIMFCSRLDWEKNPIFMLKVARLFLEQHSDWQWVVTTSAKEVRSNDADVLRLLAKMDNEFENFVVKTGLTKNEYYTELCKSAIQFNCALQDYVSWTLLEACIAGCDIVYPNFRSFLECVPNDRRYLPDKVESALNVLTRVINDPRTHYNIPQLSDQLGRLKETEIIFYGTNKEYNIWKEQT